MVKPSRLSNNKKRQLQQLIAQAMQAYQAQNFNMCETLCKRIETMHPGDADAANLRGAMCLAVHGTDEALPFFIAAARAAPKRIEFQINLGRIYLSREEFPLAFEAYSKAAGIQDDNLYALLGCCRALIGLGRFSEADNYLHLTKGLPLTLTDEFMQKAAACADLNHTDESFSLLDELLECFPDYVDGYLQKAVLLLEAGDKEEAAAAINRVLELQPFHAKALSMMAEICRFDSADDSNMIMIQEALELGQPNREEAALLHVAMGRAMHKLGNHETSFEHFREANDIRAAQSGYCLDDELKHLDAIMQSFTADVFERRSDVGDDAPVFIIGMPRCGSTLTEQILLAHPDVSGRGEIGLFEQVLAELAATDSPFAIDGAADLLPDQWGEVGRLYLDRLRDSGVDAVRIVDKSLKNICLLGAIHCALPRARMVHVRRNPLDTCLSIFTSDIQDSYYRYGLRLETLGAYYQKYQQLMQHWREVLPAGVIYELDYEKLVVRQEEESRRLLEYCGLDWDDACLEFQKAKHRVRTASIMQVRQAINTGSVERWRRYEHQLQPLIDILGID